MTDTTGNPLGVGPGTALPWQTYYRPARPGVFGEVAASFIHAGPNERDDTGFNVVARLYTTHGYDGIAEREANAAYIVRACNSFPSLYEALEGLLPPEIDDWWCPTCQVALSGSRVTNDERCDACGTFLPPEQASDDRWAKARQALSLARGEEG